MKKTLLISAVALILSTSAMAGKKYIDRLPRTSHTIESFSTTAFMERMHDTPLHHIEGVWRFPADGTEIAILRPKESGESADCYEIILLHGANRALRTGTIVGMATPAAKRGYYEARLYTRSTGSLLYSPKSFYLKTEDEDTRLIFELQKGAFSVNLWRLLPYMWRYSVHKNQDSRHVAGCVRVYPEPLPPLEPRYL